MAKYIDADRLRAEIRRELSIAKELRDNYLESPHDESYSCKFEEGKVCSLKSIISFIDSLQQEQPEESIAKEAIQLVFEEKLTPFKDGNQWSFLLGPNIQEGVCGFGDTILDAAIDFYKDYSTTRIHIGELKKTMEQPEADLEEEMVLYSEKHFDYNSEWDTLNPKAGGYFGPIEFDDIARHFFELGQKDAANKYDEIEYNRQRAEEEMSDKTLDEAAEEKYPVYWKNYPKDGIVRSESSYDTNKKCRNAFIAGAKWMAEQGVSWEDKMTYYDGFLLYGKDERAFTMEGNFNEGDKVIVQIRKKEENR